MKELWGRSDLCCGQKTFPMRQNQTTNRTTQREEEEKEEELVQEEGDLVQQLCRSVPGKGCVF